MTLGWRLGTGNRDQTLSGRGGLSILSFSQTSPKACHNKILKKMLVLSVDKKVANNWYQHPKLVPVQTESWERQLVLPHG